MEAMTREVMDLVAELFSTASMIGYATSGNERKSHGDAARKIVEQIRETLEAHLAQRAQAVDAGAIREALVLIAELMSNMAGDESMRWSWSPFDLHEGEAKLRTAHDAITRALSGEKAGPVGDGWTARRDDELRLWWVYSPSGAAAGIYDQAAGVHAELLRQLAQFLPASPTPDKEGEG